MNIRNNVIKLTAAIFLSGCVQSALAVSEAYSKTGPAQLDEIIVVAEVKADKVWELKESGKIMPLEDLLKQVRRDYPGRVIEIELDDDDGNYIYELELVDENGVVWDLEVDASSGKVLKYEQDD